MSEPVATEKRFIVVMTNGQRVTVEADQLVVPTDNSSLQFFVNTGGAAPLKVAEFRNWSGWVEERDDRGRL